MDQVKVTDDQISERFLIFKHRWHSSYADPSFPCRNRDITFLYLCIFMCISVFVGTPAMRTPVS